MTYTNHHLARRHHALRGLGVWPADANWTPGTGQAPRNDPRIIRQGAVIKGTWQPSGISSGDSAAAAQALLGFVQNLLPGFTVSLVGSTGWITGGLIELQVTVPNATTTFGQIRGAFFDATTNFNSKSGISGQLINPLTIINTSDVVVPSTTATTTSTTTPATTLPGATTALTTPAAAPTDTIAGIPIWALGVGGVAVLGILGFVVLTAGKTRRPSMTVGPVAANRRRWATGGHVRMNARAKFRGLGRGVAFSSTPKSGASVAFTLRTFDAMRRARGAGKKVPMSAALRYWPAGSAVTHHQLKRLLTVYNSSLSRGEVRKAFGAVLRSR